MLNPDQVVEIFSELFLSQHERVGLHEPHFAGNEWKYVKECLDTGWVSSVGKFVDRFESDLAEYTGAKYAVVTTNGTVALQMALLLAGVQAGDEVLVPSFTFVATCNAVNYCGAIPHFIDSDADTLGIDVKKLAEYLEQIVERKDGHTINRLTQRPLRAICVMHTFGHSVDLDPLAQLAEEYGLVLIEDAAEALGSFYKGRHVGHRGLLGTLSFNGNKIITTGGGGAILTNDQVLAQRAKHLTTTAKIPHPWLYQHDEVGYNFRLPNLNAALGCAQLELLPQFLEAKRQLADQYAAAFANCPGLKFVLEPIYGHSNYWLNALLLDIDMAHYRDTLLMQLNERKVGVRPTWELMHKLPMYESCPRMNLDMAESLSARLINIPSSVFLSKGINQNAVKPSVEVGYA